MDKKAQIVLKEGTRAMVEYGNAIWGYIKEVTEVAKSKISESGDKILFVIDEFDERLLISCNDIRNINYL